MATVQTMFFSEEATGVSQSTVARGEAAAEMGEGLLILLRRTDEFQIVVGADDFEKGGLAFSQPLSFWKWLVRAMAPPCLIPGATGVELGGDDLTVDLAEFAGEEQVGEQEEEERRRGRRSRCTKD